MSIPEDYEATDADVAAHERYIHQLGWWLAGWSGIFIFLSVCLIVDVHAHRNLVHLLFGCAIGVIVTSSLVFFRAVNTLTEIRREVQENRLP